MKEFEMQSFYEIVDGRPKPHDFVIDEYKVYAETPLNEEVVVEFVANRAGEFVYYYCAKPGHRQAGQWGTLKVIE